jgi:ABC-type uncharacterized transport system substrate-binding protein
MTRREFITLLGGAAAAWPVAARAQEKAQMRRIGVLTTHVESDQELRSWMAAFATRLQQLGWTDGKTLRIDYRWGGGDATRIAPLAKELVELQPDVLLAGNNSCAVALRQYTLAIPIVFVQVGDPVAAGLVTNLARPEGNITGFNSFEFAIGGKWIEALKDCVPRLRQAAVFFDPSTPAWSRRRGRSRRARSSRRCRSLASSARDREMRTQSSWPRFGRVSKKAVTLRARPLR